MSATLYRKLYGDNMEKENQRITLTKKLLKDGLLRLAKKKSIEKISVLELCRESGINRATFYRHYESPRDVLVEMERELFAQIKERIRKPVSMPDVERYLVEVCLFLEDNARTLELLILNNSDTLFVSVLEELCNEVIYEVANLNLFRNYDPESLEILALYYSGGSYFILRKWLLGELKKTPQQIAAMGYRLLAEVDWKDAMEQLGAVDAALQKKRGQPM